MRRPGTYTALEEFGRVRLSPYFYMRDFLYSEISNFCGVPNLPESPDLAIATGKQLCSLLLDPLVETFGPIAVRSAYRSPELNQYGASRIRPQKMAQNPKNYAGHIWDRLDDEGRMGACASIVIPWFADQYVLGRSWTHLAWWLHDHLPYSELWFFPKLAAFNLTWRQEPLRKIGSYAAPKGLLLRAGAEPDYPLRQRQKLYADFPTFRGISYPLPPGRAETSE